MKAKRNHDTRKVDRNAMAPIRQRAVQAVHESRPVAGASCRGRCAGAALAAEVGAVVEAWERERYPEIRRQARKAGARIYFADEASLCLNYYAGTTSAPACQTLVLCDTGWHLRVNMLSAVDPRGSMRFKVHIGTVNVGVFIAFLQRLMHDAEGPVFVIVDGYPAHRAKKVQRFVASTEGRLRLFFLPPYAPHLNPDEAVWAHVKREAGKQAPGSTGEMLALARSVPHRIQRMPRLVRSFFHQPECQYILANQTGNT